MMNRCASVALLGLVFMTGCGSKAEFKEFTSKDGRYKVLLPGTPKEAKASAAGGTAMNNATVEEKNGAYMVSYAEMPIPPGTNDAILEPVLDGAMKGMVSAQKGNMTSSSKITLDGKYPGRSLEATLPEKDGLVRAKIFLVNGRLYQVLVVGTKSWAGSADATKFLDSFALLPS